MSFEKQQHKHMIKIAVKSPLHKCLIILRVVRSFVGYKQLANLQSRFVDYKVDFMVTECQAFKTYIFARIYRKNKVQIYKQA